MNESTVNIKLNTTANTSGADKLNASLGITATREKELAAMRTQFLSAAEAEVAKVNQLAEASRKLAAAKEAEAAASKRQPLLAEGLERERQEVQQLIAAQQQLAAARTKEVVSFNPYGASAAAAASSLNALHGAQERASGSSRNMGNALLQGSRALQDMQYGLAGAVNNLEGIASALGLGAGVAGIVTVLAVTLQQLGPQIAKFFDGLSTDKIQTDGLKSFVDQLGLVSTGRDRAAIAGERFKNQLAAEDAALKAQMAVIKENTALFNLRNAAAQGQAEFETQQAIEDIRAQGLPREVEAAAIAEKKLALLERQAELQKAASDQALITAQQEAAAAAAAAASAEQEAQRLEEIIARSARLIELKEEEIRLVKEYEAAQAAAFDPELGQLESPQTEALTRRIEANRAGQAAANRGALADASTPDLARQAREAATARARAAAEAANAIAPAARMESERAAVESQRRDQERQRIAREASPGVFDPRNVIQAPANPLTGLAPLPTAGPAGLRQPFAQPAALPGNLPTPLPQLDTAPLNNAAESNTKANEAVASFAQTVSQKNAELERKLKELEAKMKASRP